MRKIIQLLIPFGVAVILIGFILLFPDFSHICELKAYDLKMGWTAKLKPQDKKIADRIKIVNVADSTIREMGWPKKEDHARMIDILSRQKATLIAYDWIFYDQDDGLAQAVKKSGRIIWPVLFDLSLDSGYSKEQYSRSVVSLLEDSSIDAKQSPSTFWHTTTVTLSHSDILRHAKAIGHISARNEEGNPSNDGVFRKVALVVNFAGQYVPSLSLQMACNYLHVSLDKIKIIPGREIVLPQASFPEDGRLRVEDVRIPINERGEMWIYFPGRWEEKYFEPFWFENVLDKHMEQSNWPKYQGKFKDNILFVGNASGKSKDTHVIPVEDNFPGVGIHANALFTILSGNFIRFAGPTINILIILILALVMGIISIRKPLYYTSAFHLLLLIGYGTITFLIFGELHFNLPTVFPMLTILIGGIAGLVYYSIWEQREKESLLKEYEEVQTGLQKKDRELRRLVLDQRRTEQQTEEKDRKMQILEQEKKNLLGQYKGLQKRLKDSSIQAPPKYVPLKEVLEQLRSECLKVGIITENERMLEIFDRARKAAKSDSPVLILGESGTGKELVAQAIHSLSDRKDREIVVVPTIQENLVESELFGYVKGAFTNANMNKQGFFATANGSTIFLDEIGDMPAAIQVKLLRVLSKGEYTPVGSTRKCKTDARIVAATNRNLQKEMETGNFREDLYYRINVINIELPPLRDRKEDIEALANYFVEMYCKNKPVKSLSERAVEVLRSYNWPGNIRHLENVIERAVALTDGELITESDLELIPSNGKSSNGVSHHKVETFEPDIPINVDKAVPSRADHFKQPLDIDGDNAFLEMLNQNNFTISKTAKVRGKGRDATRERFKGLCLKALAENDWDITQAAKSIAQNDGNQKRVETKIKEYYDNTLKELQNYTSIEQLKQQVGKKYRNMPKKFHQYILKMFEEKEGVV